MDKQIQTEKKNSISVVLQSFLMTVSPQPLNAQAGWGVCVMLALYGKTAGMATVTLATSMTGSGRHRSRPLWKKDLLGGTPGAKRSLDTDLNMLFGNELTNVPGPCSW